MSQEHINLDISIKETEEEEAELEGTGKETKGEDKREEERRGNETTNPWSWPVQEHDITITDITWRLAIEAIASPLRLTHNTSTTETHKQKHHTCVHVHIKTFVHQKYKHSLMCIRINLLETIFNVLVLVLCFGCGCGCGCGEL